MGSLLLAEPPIKPGPTLIDERSTDADGIAEAVRRRARELQQRGKEEEAVEQPEGDGGEEELEHRLHHEHVGGGEHDGGGEQNLDQGGARHEGGGKHDG